MIKYDEMLSNLNDAVAFKGADYVYPRSSDGGESCAYVFEGEPDCIAAHALVALGVTLDTLSNHEGEGADAIPVHQDGEYVHVTTKAKFLLRQAQIEQDSGTPWGDAVVGAVEYIHTLNFNEDEEYMGVKAFQDA